MFDFFVFDPVGATLTLTFIVCGGLIAADWFRS